MRVSRVAGLLLTLANAIAVGCSADDDAVVERARPRRTTTTEQGPPSTLVIDEPDGPPPTPEQPDDTISPDDTAVINDEVFVAFGSEYVIDSSGSPVGLQVLEFLPDATDAVVASGSFEPGIDGDWAVVRVRLTNYSDEVLTTELIADLYDGDLEEESWGCPAEEWWADPGYSTLLPGGSVDGAFCFVPTSTPTDQAMLAITDVDGDYAYFAVSAAGGGDVPSEAPPERPAPRDTGPGGFMQPLPLGSRAEVEGWQLAVTSFVPQVSPATGTVLPEGWVVVAVGIDATYQGAEPYDSWMLTIAAVDDRRILVSPTVDSGSAAGCEAGPMLVLPSYVPSGYNSGAKFLCYTVPQSAVASLRLAVTTGWFVEPSCYLATV